VRVYIHAHVCVHVVLAGLLALVDRGAHLLDAAGGGGAGTAAGNAVAFPFHPLP